jgi:Tfp pilus assembly protein PilV
MAAKRSATRGPGQVPTRGRRGWGRGSRGMSAIEVIVALALLSATAVAFLSGLTTALTTSRIADERSVAQTLAQSELEYVKSQEYSAGVWAYTVTSSGSSSSNEPDWFDTDHALGDQSGTYTVAVEAADFDADEDGDIDVDDEGIRRITATVSHHGAEVLMLDGYKVDRSALP